MFGVMCSTVLVSCYLCWTESSLFFHPLGSTNPRTDLLNELGPADVGVSLQEYNEKKMLLFIFFWYASMHTNCPILVHLESSCYHTLHTQLRYKL